MSLKSTDNSEHELARALLGDASVERRALLSEAPSKLGAAWANVWRESLRDEGRDVAGGWPGTLPEARSRVQEYFGRELALRGMPVLTAAEFDAATAATYERARRDWLSLVRGNKTSLQGAS